MNYHRRFHNESQLRIHILLFTHKSNHTDVWMNLPPVKPYFGRWMTTYRNTFRHPLCGLVQAALYNQKCGIGFRNNHTQRQYSHLLLSAASVALRAPKTNNKFGLRCTQCLQYFIVTGACGAVRHTKRFHRPIQHGAARRQTESFIVPRVCSACSK